MRINHLTKKYKGFSLTVENLNIEGTGLIGLIGDNGAGKTTLMNVLSGKIIANKLDAELFGLSKGFANEKVHQNSFMMTVSQCYRGKLINIIDDFAMLYREFDYNKCIQIINLFELNLSARFRSLSQGMRAQFKIAIAEALPVSVLYLDEITNGLDTFARAIICEHIKEMSKNKLVFFSTHILDKNMEYFDRVLFLVKGKIIYDVKQNETLIKVNDSYCVAAVNDIENKDKYDIIEVYKEICDNKVRRKMSG